METAEQVVAEPIIVTPPEPTVNAKAILEKLREMKESHQYKR